MMSRIGPRSAAIVVCVIGSASPRSAPVGGHKLPYVPEQADPLMAEMEATDRAAAAGRQAETRRSRGDPAVRKQA